MNSPFSLQDKTIVITGGSGYLGTPMVKHILDAGAKVIALSRSKPNIEHERLQFIEVNLEDEKEVTRILSQIKSDHKKIHGLVNGAYAGIVGSTKEITPEDFRRANYFSLELPYKIARELKNNLLPESGQTSSIINIASMYGVVSPDPKAYDSTSSQNPPHYGASKAGMIQLTKYLAVEWGNLGIRVNAISPGPFPNPQKNDQAFMDRLSVKTPLGRTGKAEELAPSLVFLLSQASSYITGTNLRVDGGWTVW